MFADARSCTSRAKAGQNAKKRQRRAQGKGQAALLGVTWLCAVRCDPASLIRCSRCMNGSHECELTDDRKVQLQADVFQKLEAIHICPQKQSQSLTGQAGGSVSLQDIRQADEEEVHGLSISSIESTLCRLWLNKNTACSAKVLTWHIHVRENEIKACSRVSQFCQRVLAIGACCHCNSTHACGCLARCLL